MKSFKFSLFFWGIMDEGLNFEQLRFRMADVGNLRIKERSDVGWAKS